MTPNLDQFQEMLLTLTNSFLDELPDRCQSIEDLVLMLEKSKHNPGDAFAQLFREVHSLKGSGGTHGFSIITRICHQLENLMSEAAELKRFDEKFISQALSHVDLLRQVPVKGLAEHDPRWDDLDKALDTLHSQVLAKRRSGLLVEPSSAMARLYLQAVAHRSVRWTVVDSGLKALELLLHQNFDLAVVGRELKDINGVALVLALRENRARNQNIDVILITSSTAGLPPQARINSVIKRGVNAVTELQRAVDSLS